MLLHVLEHHACIMKELEISYFYDRVVAKQVLRNGAFMQFLPMYQNDDEMVLYTLNHSSRCIGYIGEKYLSDRRLAKLAVEHSQGDTVMQYPQMKPYRSDRELMLRACEIDPYNFTYADASLQDDHDLAKLVLLKKEDPNDMYDRLSDRLKDDLELALIECEREYPRVECFSERLRDHNEIAERLLSLHNKNSSFFSHLSDRIHQAYDIPYSE